MESLLPFVLILLAFYFLVIRPQRNRARKAAQMQAALEPGVEVMTTAGLYGTVTEVLEDSVRIEVSPGVIMRFTKAAIGRVLTEEADDMDELDQRAADDAGSDDAVAGDDAKDLRDDASRRAGPAE